MQEFVILIDGSGKEVAVECSQTWIKNNGECCGFLPKHLEGRHAQDIQLWANEFLVPNELEIEIDLITNELGWLIPNLPRVWSSRYEKYPRFTVANTVIIAVK